MSTVGTCSYCGQPATRTCQMCGKALCREHSDDDNPQVCVSCSTGSVVGPGDDVNMF